MMFYIYKFLLLEFSYVIVFFVKSNFQKKLSRPGSFFPFDDICAQIKNNVR